MDERKTCERCGVAIPAGSAGGMCPRCMMELAALGERPASPGLPPGPEELAPFFPRLEIVRLIGRGGMGAVYEARQPELDRKVALKVLPAELGGDPTFAERFEREARLLARLDHPGVVRVHDAGRAGSWYWLAMEYVDGVDLRQMMRAGEVAPQQALSIVGQLCVALQYAHDQGVVHRDIKPENVLVDRRGVVKIADFGLAKLLGRSADSFTLTRSDQAMGTLHYMAPEQVEHPLSVDHRADIYSLGVVFYELLTGGLPIGRFPMPSARPGVDARLDEVVLKTLEKAPERRYQHASDVKADVERASSAAAPAAFAAQGGEPGEAAGSSEPVHLGAHRAPRHAGHGAGRNGRRRPLVWALGCGCLTLLGLAFLGSLLLVGSRSAAAHRLRAEAAREQALAARAEAESRHALELAGASADPSVPLLLAPRKLDGVPTLTGHAVAGLGLDEGEEREVRAALERAWEAYLALEQEHTTSVEVSEDRKRTLIAPFAEQREELLAELQAALIAALGARAGVLCAAGEAQAWRSVAPYGDARVDIELTRHARSVGLVERRTLNDGATLETSTRVSPLPPQLARFAP